MSFDTVFGATQPLAFCSILIPSNPRPAPPPRVRAHIYSLYLLTRTHTHTYVYRHTYSTVAHTTLIAMSQKLALALSFALNLQLALSAAAHNPNNGQKRAPTLVERGPPYPTGSGYDAVPLSSIVPLSPGTPRVSSPAPKLTNFSRVLFKCLTCAIYLSRWV